MDVIGEDKMEDNNKIRVMELIGQLGDGGAETLVANYVKLVDKNKFETCVVTIYKDKTTANYKRIEKLNIPVFSFFEKHNFMSKIVWRLSGKKYAAYKLKGIIKKFKPDVIHVHLENLKYLVPISKELNNIKLLYTCHSLPKLKLDGSNKEEGDAARYLIKNNGLRMIALHEHMKKELNEMFNVSNTCIIKNGIDFNEIKNVAIDKSKIRKELGIPEDALVVGHIGRFSKVKNHKFLLEIFEAILKKENNAYLLLVGNGNLKQDIEEEIEKKGFSKKVSMLSHRTDIPQILKSMDLFIFPSLYEGLSVTMVEAQVSGLRCIVSSTVNEQSILSCNTITCSLDDNPDYWAEVALNNEIKNDNYGNIDEYDLNREILNLEKLYCS